MKLKKSSNRPRKAKIGGIESKDVMSQVTGFADITPNLPFTEFVFYELFRWKFIKAELGRMKSRLPLQEMAETIGERGADVFIGILKLT